MKTKPFEVVKYLFKGFCFVAVISMISVWVCNFLKDEDLCLVDYKTIQTTNELDFPVVSLCFMGTSSFIQQRLEDLGTTTWKYNYHLKGKGFNESLTKVDYNQVTINLEDYYNRSVLVLKNGTPLQVPPSNVTIQVAASDFSNRIFRKCFSIDASKLNLENVKYVKHVFSIEFFRRYVKPVVGSFYAMIHYPNQFLLSDPGSMISSSMNDSKGLSLGILIKKVEILRRRNKPKEPCLTTWRNWDNLTLLRYTKDIGCVAPYQKPLYNFSTCSTKKKLEEWSMFPASTKEKSHYQPCEEMPRTDFVLAEDTKRPRKSFFFSVTYPPKAKIITQSKAVDINSLIGNIGGYIGLFLGILYYCNPYYIKQLIYNTKNI